MSNAMDLTRERVDELAELASDVHACVSDEGDECPIDELATIARWAIENVCHHGWRSHPPKNGQRIVTECPSCRAQSIFIGDGGHLTCAMLDPCCKQPDIAQQIVDLKSERDTAIRERDEEIKVCKGQRELIDKLDDNVEKARTEAEDYKELSDHYLVQRNEARAALAEKSAEVERLAKEAAALLVDDNLMMGDQTIDLLYSIPGVDAIVEKLRAD